MPERPVTQRPIRYEAEGFSSRLVFDDGTVVDLDRPVRLIKMRGRTHGTYVVGKITGPMNSSSTFGSPITFMLEFDDGVHATWVPAAGDILENI
jgi:hypothetical protein